MTDWTKVLERVQQALEQDGVPVTIERRDANCLEVVSRAEVGENVRIVPDPRAPEALMGSERRDLAPGDLVVWRRTVSNYGHQRDVPAVVESVGPKRVRVRTRFADGKPEIRRTVKPENLRRAAPLEED